MTRRDILKLSAAAAAVAPTLSFAASESGKRKTADIDRSSKQRVIVCGGGFGGLTTAKYIKEFYPEAEVMLIEKNSHFTSCPYSNLWLGGIEGTSLQELSYSYLQAANNFGYRFVNETVTAIDKKAQTVTTDGQTYAYDRLVLAGGIEYDYDKLFADKEIAKECYMHYPPAMKPGSEHLSLKNKVENFSGGNFIVTVPAGGYRCPPAPYERACMIANYFKKNGIKGKVLLLDPREKPGAKPEGFLYVFKHLYADYIEYMPMSEIKDIDAANKRLTIERFNKETYLYETRELPMDEGNIIPPMKAAKLVELAGIKRTPHGWAQLEKLGFASVSDPRVYVVGDSGGHPFPKSGHMANSCGYIAAKHIAYAMQGKAVDKRADMPSNICYSMVGENPLEGISVHHEVEVKGGTYSVSAQSTKRPDANTGESIKPWFDAIMNDLFGPAKNS